MKTSAIILSAGLVLAACADRFDGAEQDEARAINCATAEGDIRVLESEKAHVEEEMASGVFVFVPAAFVIGVATGTEETRLEIAGGAYNKKIKTKITEIKAACDL